MSMILERPTENIGLVFRMPPAAEWMDTLPQDASSATAHTRLSSCADLPKPTSTDVSAQDVRFWVTWKPPAILATIGVFASVSFLAMGDWRSAILSSLACIAPATLAVLMLTFHQTPAKRETCN